MQLIRTTLVTGAIALASGIAVLPAEPTRSAVPANPDAATIVHVLNRIGFGPAPGDVERVRRVGLDQFIDQQLHPERIADHAMTQRLAGFETLTKSSRDLAENYFMPAMMERRRAQQQAAAEPSAEPQAMTSPGDAAPNADKRAMRTPDQIEAMRAERQVFAELSQQKVLRAAYSERQLEEVMVDFWFNHFNVFAGKGATRLYLTEYERDAIRPHVFGKFRDLLGATAQSPAMLFYLDNWQSSAPEGSQRAVPPRLRANRGGFGIGARRGPRPADAPSQTPPNRRPRGLNENYARELMELHTLGVDGGYTQKDVQEVARAFTGWTIANPRQGGGFQYEPRMHDDGEKVVLGRRLKAGGGRQDAEQVLDLLASHPSTARFIATKLARRFVSDEPPAPLVDRAAARFRETGGDIREVVRTIATSPEFFAKAAYRAKVKTPFEFVASAVRAVSSEAVNAQPLAQAIRDLGMPPYQCQPPTGYADRADAWVNTGALLNRMNFAVALTGTRMRGIRTAAQGDVIVEQVLAGDLSDATRSTVAKATEPSQTAALLLGSPEFQRR
jgi:uncharacterized protein (DUF1800 family)